MKPRCRAARDRGRAGRGFTLIELLVVVVIIAILIGILVPAVSAVRRSARETASRAILGTLGTGLEMFKADGRVGGGYPPSFSDSDGTVGFPAPPYGQVNNPYLDLPGSPGTTTIRVNGAGFLVWALVGADQLGTPGFKVFRTDPGCAGYNQARVWSADTDAGNYGDNPRCSGAYALRTDDQRPIQARSGPFIDPSKIQMSTWDRTTGRFEIPAEQGLVSDNAARPHPMFLDSFGFPILYWKADSAGVLMADRERQGITEPTRRGIYHWEDNGPLLDPNGASRLVLRAGADDHRLDMLQQDTFGLTPDNFPFDDEGYAFARYIMDTSVQAKLAPHRPDSYLLVTPGADGVYGTGDDITNFEHNGR